MGHFDWQSAVYCGTTAVFIMAIVALVYDAFGGGFDSTNPPILDSDEDD